MENRPFPIPTGEAFLVKTPYLDEIGKRLYREQQQREAQRVADAKAMDKQDMEDVTKLRPADINTHYEKYNTYKTKWMNLNRKGHVITPDEQLDLLKTKADMLNHMARSIEDKDATKLRKADYIKNPKNYQEHAPAYFTERDKLPIDKMQVTVPNPKTGKTFNLDMSDIDGNIKYQLGTTDFSKDFNNAVGQKIPMRIGESEPFKTADGLQTQKKIYKGFSKTAPEVAASFLQSVVGSKKTADLVKEHPELNDENVLAKIDSDYDKLINSDVYKNAYKGKVTDFPAWMHDTPQGKIAMYLAKQYAINNVPKEELDKPINILGETRKFQKDMQEDRQRFTEYMEGVKNNNIVSRGANNPNNYTNTTGNALDEFGGVRTLEGGKTRIEAGIVYNKDGTAKTGETVVVRELIPVNVTNALNAAKIPIPRTVKIFSRNGVIESIMTPNGEISRQAMENLQKKLNTEPVKAPQPVFGKEQKSSAPPKPKGKTKDTLGIL